MEAVERAKEALVAAVPTARSPGRPLAEALAEFEDELREAESRMAAWRHEELERERTSCRDGLREALRRAEVLRLDAPELGFEPLLATVGDLIAPLEAFETAAERLRELGA